MIPLEVIDPRVGQRHEVGVEHVLERHDEVLQREVVVEELLAVIEVHHARHADARRRGAAGDEVVTVAFARHDPSCPFPVQRAVQSR